jgi:hypothetical protein
MELRAGEGLLRETFTQFRACGRGRTECVVYWTGPLDQPGLADQVVHPKHTASRSEYVVNRAWAVAFALEGARLRRAVRLQVHVHPHEAFHSITDDEHAIVSKPGALSLVVPDSAFAPVSLDGCHLAELQGDGTWRAVSPDELITLEP